MNSTCELGRHGASALKPYPAYRDSGVEWLGEVPAHWEVRQLGRLGRLFKGGGGTKEDEREDGIPCIRYGDLYTHHRSFITASRACVTPELTATTYTPIRYGDVLFAGSGETIDEIGKSAVNLIRGPACCGGDVIIFRPSIDADARFLGYATDCSPSACQKACIGRGFTVMHIYSSDLKYMTVAIPPLSEQAAIVRFLDYADRCIRRHIRAKEKLIALLEEQKQAVIHQAVTGQIDVRTGQPYGEYKASGVWGLDEVPAHWKVRRLRTISELRVSNVDKHVKDGERPVRLCNYVDVYKNDRIGRRMAFTSATATPGEIERFRLRRGDVLITKDSESWNDIGVPALVESTDDGIVCGYHLALLRPFPDHIDGGYLFRALQSSGVAHQFHVEANGVTRFGLTHNGIKSIWLPVPSLAEQAAIVRFLDHADRRIGRYIGAMQKLVSPAASRTEREASLLGDYRTRLIADVVTGKLDVRKAAAGLPQADPLAAESDSVDGVDHEAGSEHTGWRHAVEEDGPLADVADP